MSAGYTDADVQLVAEAMWQKLKDTDFPNLSGPPSAACFEDARAILTALAGAGRLTPDGAEVRKPRNDQGSPMEVWLDEERESITVEINGAKRFRRWWFGKTDGAPAVEWCHGVHEDAVRLDAWVEADEDGTT